MADLDLQTALSMFNDSTNKLMLTRAISGANEQVNQIRNSEMDETQKRVQMQQIGNNLVAHMASLGTPATTMQMVAGAMSPPKFDNANQMNQYGIMTGNSDIQKQAAQQQKFEEAPTMDKLRLQLEEQGKLRAALYGDRVSKENTELFAKFSKNIDPTDSIRSVLGQGAQALQNMDRVQQVIGDAANDLKSANAVPSPKMALIAEGLVKAVKNGVASQEELHSVLPNNVGKKEADIQNYISNEMNGANQGKLLQLYQDIVNRERSELTYQQAETIMTRAQAQAGQLYKRDPDSFKQSVAAQLSKSGVPVKPEDIVVDAKGKMHLPQLDQAEHIQSIAEENIRKAYQIIHSSNPDAADMANAQRVMQALSLNPSMSVNAAISKARDTIRRRAFQ